MRFTEMPVYIVACSFRSIAAGRAVLTEQRDVVGGARHGVGYVDEEDTPGQQRRDADVHLLRRDAVEDGQQQRGREDARQQDVHHVELVTASQRHREGDVGEQLRRTALEVELVPLDARSDDLPLTVRFVAAHNASQHCRGK